MRGRHPSASGKTKGFFQSKGMMATYLVLLLCLYIAASLFTVNRSLEHKVELLESDLALALREKHDALSTANQMEKTADDLKDKVNAVQLGHLAQKREFALPRAGAEAAEMEELQKQLQVQKAEIERLRVKALDQKRPPAAPAADPQPTPAPEKPTSIGKADIQKQAAIKAAMMHSWKGYVDHAFGQDELRPLSQAGNNWLGLGGTIIDSMDTLLIMGLTEEYQKCKNWVSTSLNFDNVNMEVSFFETTIRVLGGLMTAYEMTGDEIMLTKGRDLGDRLMAAFNSPTGIPYSNVNLVTRAVSSPGWTGGATVLAEIGTVQLEFNALSRHSKDPKYSNAAMKVFELLQRTPKNQGLYPLYIDPHSGAFTVNQISTGAMGDSFYEYLLKVWIHRGQKDQYVKDMFDESAQGIMSQLVQLSSPSKLMYIAEQKDGSLVHKMDHLGCFIGGLFALGSSFSTMPATMLKVGAGVAETCYQMYKRMPTGLSPEFVTFEPGADLQAGALYNIQRPETVETLFYMWRYTHDEKYREWGWEIFQAFEKWTKVSTGGYVGLRDVRSVPPPQDDTQQTFWLAETLKYLYLLFSDDTVIPLTEYVFNTEAHPLKIYNRDAP
mmetsp:Transcript_34867/g.79519  ORF Transcript_34867/g.79519 Transcript_34867/m.79519 type:complete len:609 (+) Transcript_34867:18-1844(+)